MNEHEDTAPQTEWKPIPQFSGWMASSDGDVISPSGKQPSQSYADGYARINIWHQGKNTRRYVHVLVMAAFCGPKPEGMQVNHKDGNKKNNRLSNLEYCTPSQNTTHAHANGLVKTKPVGTKHYNHRFSELDVLGMRIMAFNKTPQRKIAREFGTRQATVSAIARGLSRASG